MKKKLVLVRHAKSSWADPMQSDFERPLNERGEHDAPLMGRRLKELNILPELIISSTAKRAKQTAKRIAGAIDYDKELIRFEGKLYHCGSSTFEEVIDELDDRLSTVYIVAHNPGITEFVNELSELFRIDNIPTCGVVVAEINAERWSDFNLVPKSVLLFEYPKKFYSSE